MTHKNKYIDFNEDNIYCYENTELLKNKLNIKEKQLLNDVERGYTTFKLSKLHLEDPSDVFDIKFYLGLHEYLFGDIYDFAGKIRTVNISKNSIPFCRPEYIYKYLNYTLLEMNSNVHKIKNEDDLLNFLSYYYGELDIIHPFREGNGRVQREFFRQYMSYINKKTNLKGYKLEYSNWLKDDKQLLIEGCIVSARYGDTAILKEVLSKSLVNELEITKNKTI